MGKIVSRDRIKFVSGGKDGKFEKLTDEKVITAINDIAEMQYHQAQKRQERGEQTSVYLSGRIVTREGAFADRDTFIQSRREDLAKMKLEDIYQLRAALQAEKAVSQRNLFPHFITVEAQLIESGLNKGAVHNTCKKLS